MDTKQFNFPRNYAAEPYSGVTFEQELFSRVLAGLAANPGFCGQESQLLVTVALDLTGRAVRALNDTTDFTTHINDDPQPDA